jgi:hypothetical protein
MVRAVTLRWLTALADGNGQAYCGVLSRALRAERDVEAKRLGQSLHRHVTCAEANSADPPGMDRRQRAQLALARRQTMAGLRIDSVTIKGTAATVNYSWLVPKHPSPILSFKRPAHGNRIESSATLSEEHGAWKIG